LTLFCIRREEMIIKVPVVVSPLKEGGYMARCEEIRATATGDTPDDAIHNLREAIDEMIKEYGQNEVFQDLMPESQVQVIEVAV
jgi:predicted RNase H-like HicB family nuclease